MNFLKTPSKIFSSSDLKVGDEGSKRRKSNPSVTPSTPNSCKVATFVDTRSTEVKKCFLTSSEQTNDGKEIFHAFLQKKYQQNSTKSIDIHLEKQVDYGIIDGAHPFKLCWDLFIGVLIIYSAVTVPYRLGFSLDSQGGWLIIDYIVDTLFFVDMVVSFNTSFSNGGKEVIQNRHTIAKRYLRTWFLPDFISTFPFDTIVFLTVKSFSSSNLRTFKLVRVLRLFRLLKIFRIIRLNRKLQNAKAGGHINLLVYDLLMVMISVFFMAHFFSCIFYQFLDCGPDEDNFSACGNKPAYSQYLLSLSWSLQTILNIGYGNVVLSSVGGRIFSIFAMTGGAIIFGFVLVVMMQAASEKEEQKNLAIMGAYLSERSVSHKMKLTIWRHCRYYYSKKALYDEPELFQTAPSALRRRFFDAMKSNINKLHVLERNFTTLSRIQKHLHPLLVEPGDSIVHQGDYCTDLFFVQTGQVHAFIHSVRTQFKQTFVGEFCGGYGFGFSNALRVKDKCWATYRANETSDLLWIDITRLNLDEDILQDFELHAMHEMKLHDQIEALFSNLTVIDKDAELYATPSVIQKREIVSLADIEGTITDYKELRAHKKIKLYRVFRPVKGDSKRHEIAFESSADMRKRFIINPSSKHKTYFDGYIALCTILVIVILPLRMGFSIELNTAWNVYDIIIEISFIFDIVVSFFTAYEMSDLVLNTDKHHICMRYVKEWFVLDVLSGLPVSMLTLNEGFLLLKLFKFARIIRLVRVMRVFKIARLLKILKLSNNYEEKPFSTSEETYMKFLRLAFIVLIFTHISACFWSKLANDKDGSNTWEDSINVQDASLWTRYLASFYFIYVTMNTTGYGDIGAQNDLERFVLLFIVILGTFLVAHVVAEISEQNTGQQECSTERVFLLRSYLANKQIPETVQQAMLKQVTYANTMRTSFSEIKIWLTLSFQTRVELAVVCHNAVITQFPDVFDTSHPPIIYHLMTYFEPVFIMQGGYAFTFETGSGGIYLVISGIVEVMDETADGQELVLGEHRKGKLFGTECINHEMLTFLGVRAKEHTSCYRIAASRIPVMYKEHPSLTRDFFKKIQAIYKGTRQDAMKPLPKRILSKQLSLAEKTEVLMIGIKKVMKYLRSSVQNVQNVLEEEEAMDLKTVYNRTDIDGAREWSPSFKKKLASYIEMNSPSLILSNESWKQFVTLKDERLQDVSTKISAKEKSAADISLTEEYIPKSTAASDEDKSAPVDGFTNIPAEKTSSGPDDVIELSKLSSFQCKYQPAQDENNEEE